MKPLYFSNFFLQSEYHATSPTSTSCQKISLDDCSSSTTCWSPLNHFSKAFVIALSNFLGPSSASFLSPSVGPSGHSQGTCPNVSLLKLLTAAISRWGEVTQSMVI